MPSNLTPLRPGTRSSASNWWVVAQSNDIWLVESPTRPNIPVERGVKHIVPIFGPGTREQAQDFGDRTVKTSDAKWRA